MMTLGRFGCLLTSVRLVGCALALAWASAAVAEVQEPEIKSIRVGFGGYYKVGYWTPVEVTLHGGTEPVVGMITIKLPDGDGVSTVVVGPQDHAISVAPNQDAKALLYVKVGQPGDWTVSFVDQRDIYAKRIYTTDDKELSGRLESNVEFILTVGGDVGIRGRVDEKEDDQMAFVARVNRADELPTRWFGYDMIDWVVLSTSHAEDYRSLAKDSAQFAALDEWSRRGGKIVLCVGSSADEILSPGSPLATFAPGEFDRHVSLNNAASVESFSGSADRLWKDGGDENRLDVARLKDIRGVIDLHVGSDPAAMPLVVRSPRQFGQVTFVAMDVDRPPFTVWAGRQKFFDRLIGRQEKTEQTSDQAQYRAIRHFGYDDLTGQLRSALEEFKGVRVVPFAIVALLILLYIVAIGPLDFLFVKLALKRMEMTWITFPAIVVLFSAGAYALAYWTKGNQLSINQVEVVDVDVASQAVRGATWSNLFSPRTETFNLSLDVNMAPKERTGSTDTLISWMGLPGGAFGGMQRGSGGGVLFGDSYAFSPDLKQLMGMPVAVWSTKGVVTRWSCAAPETVTGRLKDRGASQITGTITNHWDRPLTDCVLLYDRWAYAIGAGRHLDPGETFTIDAQAGPQTVETYFKLAQFSDPDQARSYDPESLNVTHIVETMMFHELMGGHSFTHLNNQYQQYLDLSNQLAMGQAILLCRTSQPASQLARDQKPLTGAHDLRWTFFRFLLTVDRKGASRD